MAGRSWSRTFAIGSATLLSLYVVAGCNSILGIEPAELDETSHKVSCNWAAPNPGQECSGCDETCVNQRCKINDCLTNPECRFALFNFRGCTGAACKDAKGECGCILSANKQAQELETCLKDCGSGCGIPAANKLCEGYCACMHQQCSDDEPNGKMAGGCLQACKDGLPGGPFAINDPSVAAMWQHAPSDAQVGCLWYHCVAADTPNDHFHCDHAINKEGLCTNPPVPNPLEMLCDYPQRHGNAPCNKPSECCSGVCNDTGLCD